MGQFEWVDFYKEFAKELLKYKNNRKAVIDNVVKIFQDANINLPTLES